MSDNVKINRIRDSRRRSQLWDALTSEQKRHFLDALDDDLWHLDDLLEDYVEICQEAK